MRWRVAAAAVVLLVLSGCEAGIRIGVDANDKGGGRVVAIVTLDKEAQAIAGDLRGKLEVDDLVAAGWKVVGPEKVGNDVRITATKKFTSPAGATVAVRELDGAKGMFKDFRVTQSRGLFRTTTKFSGSVDLRQGIDAFSDDELREALGSPLGATEAEFEQRIGSALSDALPITVGVLLPGDVSSNAPQEGGGSAAWHPKLGDRIRLVASANKWNTPVIALLALGVFAAGTALTVALGRRGR
ncbi:MAG: hypothetical protein Q8K63_10780 [Acidimicrobiales bacterium]|nr:hypothetical protein [Acidimicrobiales bacterium]